MVLWLADWLLSVCLRQWTWQLKCPNDVLSSVSHKGCLSVWTCVTMRLETTALIRCYTQFCVALLRSLTSTCWNASSIFSNIFSIFNCHLCQPVHFAVYTIRAFWKCLALLKATFLHSNINMLLTLLPLHLCKYIVNFVMYLVQLLSVQLVQLLVLVFGATFLSGLL